jgi:membrane protein DedA with SNARE-associated domain
MDSIISPLFQFKYLAMFGILFLCGLGLPIPEEVTLVLSGVLVGWGEADFVLSCIACVVGILAGDSIIFGLGHYYGRSFLMSRPMRFLLSSKRQMKVAKFFRRHGSKAVFFARFFAGVRIGVYAYAGSRKMRWFRFFILDLIGALISAPISILIGRWVARTLVTDRERVMERALVLVREFGHILIGVSVLILVAILIFHLWFRRAKRDPIPSSLPPETDQPAKSPKAPVRGSAREKEEAANSRQ